MAIEHDFTDHGKVLRLIEEAQDAEQRQRELVEEQKLFVLEKDGQWETRFLNSFKGRYRGTFDQVSPILEQITGEMEASEFAIEVNPAGGDSTEDTAATYAGIIRNIENISNAKQIYSQTGASMVMAGLDGFEIVQQHIDANTFDQDLVFAPVSDWYRSVWFDLAAIKQDKSDAGWAVKLRDMPAAQYDKQFPKGTGVSIGHNLDETIDDSTYDTVTVAKIYYKKPINIELAKMSDGAIYEMDEKFESLKDEFAQAGITVVDNRTRKSWRVWTRILDGQGFLSKEEKTVFTFIPLVPVYGNYAIIKNINKYYGKTFKLMDAQRGLNFAMSAEVEDVAKAPNDAIWMTKEQGAGEDYSMMNIDDKAVRYYNQVEGHMPPTRMGGKMGNPGLQTAMANFQQLLQSTGNMDDPSMGQNPGLQSGRAIDSLISQSNNGNVKWFKSMEIGICHAYRICVDAIPRVYDGARQQRIMSEDGTGKIVSLNARVFDEKTQQNIELNDLSKGTYDVTCSMGAAFKNQQERASENLTKLLSIDPQGLEMFRDVLYKNQDWPGSDVVADRARAIGIQNGVITQDEWTDEEAQEIQAAQQAAAQQPPQEDPNMVIARAEELKGQAEMTNAQNKQVEIQGNQQLKGQELQLKGQELELDVQKFMREKDDKFNVEAAKIQQGQEKLDQAAQKQSFDQQLAIMKQQMDEMTAAVNNMKTIREASGVDAIMGPGIIDNFKTQSDIVSDEQDDIE